MKIESGKFYRTRDGRKVGPMRFDPNSDKYPWDIPSAEALKNGIPRAGGLLWDAKGCCDEVRGFDLIAEWTDAPAVDLTAITTPFGLLDAETQAALKAHGGGFEYANDVTGWKFTHLVGLEPRWLDGTVYRVKPTPAAPRDFWVDPDRGIATAIFHAGFIHVREVLE